MFISPKSISAPSPNPTKIYPSIETLLNGGLNLADKEWKLRDSQTPSVLNMWFKNGELGKRWGQEYLKSDEAPEPIAYASYRYPYKGFLIKHCGTKLYAQDITTGEITQLYTLNNSKGVFFKFNGKLYYKQAGKYIQFDGAISGNVLGSDGNCEDISKYTSSNITPTLDTIKQAGTYGFKLALTSTSGTLKHALPTWIDTSKYYLLTAYLRNGNATNVTLSKDATRGGTAKAATAVTDTTQFVRVGVLIQPSELNASNQIALTVAGASGQYVYADSIMMNPISAEDYAAGLTACMNKYAYTESEGCHAVVPYIPTVIINRTPTGGGNSNEQYNRLGAGFKNSFNGNGSATAYTLTDTNLDSTLVTATVGGVPKVEGTDFTVNRTTGIVTFTSAPASGTNNVIITAYKTVQTDIDYILNSLYVMPFGGQNDNRVFVGGGNGGYYYWTGITTAGVDPTYFAYNNYNIIGLTDEAINGFGKQFDTLCIFKDREIYGVTYSFNGTTGIFNTFPVNSQIGCDCPDTIQNINNNLVWLTSYSGVCTMVGTAVQSQRKVFVISRNINPRLLAETTLKTASSVDYDGKYWLCVGDKVYLWDYFISPYVDTGNPDESAKSLSWWYFNTINAQSFIIDATILYYIDRTNGKTVKFHTAYDSSQFYDFGNGISTLYRYPFREMGDGFYEFSVSKGYIGVRGDNKTEFDVMYITSDDPYGDPSTEQIEVGSFSWSNFSWANFTWGVMGPNFESVLIPGAKNVRYFGCEFSNSDAGKDMNISSIKWEYKITKKVK